MIAGVRAAESATLLAQLLRRPPLMPGGRNWLGVVGRVPSARRIPVIAKIGHGKSGGLERITPATNLRLLLAA